MALSINLLVGGVVPVQCEIPLVCSFYLKGRVLRGVWVERWSLFPCLVCGCLPTSVLLVLRILEVASQVLAGGDLWSIVFARTLRVCVPLAVASVLLLCRLNL